MCTRPKEGGGEGGGRIVMDFPAQKGRSCVTFERCASRKMSLTLFHLGECRHPGGETFKCNFRETRNLPPAGHDFGPDNLPRNPRNNSLYGATRDKYPTKRPGKLPTRIESLPGPMRLQKRPSFNLSSRDADQLYGILPGLFPIFQIGENCRFQVYILST